MEYVNLGRTGLRVSRICLGMMGYGNGSDRAWALDEEAAEPIIRAAVEGGVTFFDAMRYLAGSPPQAGDLARGQGEAGLQSEREAWTRVVPGAWMTAVLAGLRDPESLAPIDASSGFVATLRPYQEVGVRWLRWVAALGLGACLADDMGLGKTIQVLALFTTLARARTGRRRAARPHLLVVPASLLGNWQAEMARFAPKLRPLFFHPSAMPPREMSALSGDRLDGIDVVVTTYGTVQRTPWLTEVAWDLVVLDEAQAIKNPGAKQTRAVKRLESTARIALTGTPVENRLSDLWSLFDFLAPGLLGSAEKFTRATKGLESYAPIRRLVAPYILRRLKTDPKVISDLPDKTEVRAFCPLTKAQAALYQGSVTSLAADLRRYEHEPMERRSLVLRYLLRFKQICNHPSHWLGDGVYRPSDSGKLGRLREICEEIASRQEKALVFTQFREMTAPLAAFLATVFGRPGLVLHGSTAIKERARLVERFQSDEQVPFFVLSLKAGGTGLNLTAASHVVHFDRWWNPAVEAQATDRAFRIGQKRNVMVHKLVCRGTIEEQIDALIEKKKALASELIDGDGGVLLTEMSDEELLRTVSLDVDRALDESA